MRPTCVFDKYRQRSHAVVAIGLNLEDCVWVVHDPVVRRVVMESYASGVIWWNAPESWFACADPASEAIRHVTAPWP